MCSTLFQHSVSAANQALALAEHAQHREDVVLKGIRWSWTLERGKCSSVDGILNGRFVNSHPVDKYKCRWLSNNGVYLYESVAQQDIRMIADDQVQHIVSTTIGSEVYLSTKDSRLYFQPSSGSGWGQVQNRVHGFIDAWGPPSVPVHGGSFGLGRVFTLLEDISDPEVTVAVERGVTDTGVKSKIVRITKRDGSVGIYYFGGTGLSLLQCDHVYDGVRRSGAIVINSQVVSGVDGELQLPTVAASFYKEPGGTLWDVTRMTSDEVKLEPVPLSEMVVPAKNAVLILSPLGNMQRADFVTDISANNLTSVVEALFKRAQISSRRTGRPESDAGGGIDRRIYYLLFFNGVLVVVACVVFYIYKRRQRVQ